MAAMSSNSKDSLLSARGPVSQQRDFPAPSGLKGYGDQHPDSNKVLSCIMGNRGLARRGWLAKMGQKLYTLTREGRQVVLRLQEGGGHTPLTAPAQPQASRLSRDQEKMLLGLLNSSAVHKFEEGLKNELTFGDACRFWGISENLSGEALDQRLEKLRLTLRDRKGGWPTTVELTPAEASRET